MYIVYIYIIHRFIQNPFLDYVMNDLQMIKQ